MLNPIRSACISTGRKIVKTVSPALYRRISSHRNEGRLRRIAQTILRHSGPRILTGPFKGLQLPPAITETIYNPVLVGSYEAELHPVIESVIARGHALVVNIGCAQGYYAVGLITRMPRSRCIAFDPDPNARNGCRELALANHVANRIDVQAGCKIELLHAVLDQPAFVLSDCEGAELQLLDPHRLPALVRCDILVELHDFIVPRATDTIRRRFRQTHNILLIDAVRKDPARYPELAFLRPADRPLAVLEHRPDGMRWAWMQPRP